MGNAVGSLELPKILRARRNLTLALTNRQRKILIGCVLGDAHIKPLGKIVIEQSTKQKDYLWWKYNELKNISYPAMPKEVIRKDLKRNKEYRSFVFYLKQYFRPWRSIFYQGNKKIFPYGINLTPLSLAVWYMDDGSFSDGRAIISTEGFDEGSRKNIQKILYDEFNLEIIIPSDKKLLIKSNTRDKFYNLIKHYIVPSMNYKLPNPVTTFS